MGSQTRVPFHPSDLVFERKFDVALRKSHGDTFKNRLTTEAFTPDDQQLLAVGSAWSRSIGLPSTWKVNINLYPHLLLHIADQPEPHREHKITRIQRLMQENLELQMSWIAESLEPPLRPNTPRFTKGAAREIMKCTWLRKLLLVKDELDQLLTLLPRAEERKKPQEVLSEFHARMAQQCHWKSKLLDMTVIWSRHSCVIRHHGSSYYLPRAYLLLCHNKICDMLSVLVYSCSCPYELYNVRLVDVAVKFMDIWASLARQLDQRFFHLSKVLEGLCIGETLREVEGEENSEFLENICEGLREASGFRYHGSPLERLLTSVSIPVRHELSCLSKTMGHPFCDVEKGAATLFDKVTSPTWIDNEAVTQCVRYAKLDFIRKYLAQEKTWPLVTMETDTPRGLKFAVMLNTDPTGSEHQRKYGPFDIRGMDSITIKPNLKFDWLENFIPYVKDRTVTLGRSSVIKRYIEGSKECQSDWRETRLLLYYLLQPVHKTDHLWYLEAYNKGEWSQLANYLIIRVVPKEKEHKIESRGFGCKTPMDRARSITQEENAARFLDKYSDEHVMTLGEISLAKKLLGFRNLGAAYPGHECLVMSVDSSSWNNRFRDAAVAPVAAAVLDAAYDVDIFQKTHLAYEKSFVYMPDADQVYSWDGQLGGIEGLNQDTWVYIYLQQMKVCMEGLPYPYYLLCKGDDLRVAVMVPPEVRVNKSLDIIKKEVLSHVSSQGKRFGHVIKVEDSYVSQCYFAYSKDAYVNDVEQPQTFRKIQKCYGANNAFLTTLDDYMASSYSNAHSASKTSPSPISCFTVALFWGYESMLGHSSYSALTDAELVALLLVPNLLGGFPIIYLHNFFVRAESDLLTPFLDILQFTQRYYPRVYQSARNFLYQKVIEPNDHIASLLSDPYSLPLGRPSPPSSVLRQAATELVQKTTKNADIKELFQTIREGFEKAFLDIVVGANIYNVKLLGVLYSCTPEGIIRSLVRKFETGRSIYDALILHRGRGATYRVLKKCALAEKAVHAHRIALIRRLVRLSTWIADMETVGSWCPYQAGLEMREALWGKPVIGVTHPPLQHVLSIGRVESFQAGDHAAMNHFEIFFDPPAGPSLDTPLFTIGRYDPFTGDSTGRGLHHPEATITSHNMLSTRVRDLIEVHQWSQMTGYINNQLCASNLTAVTEHLLKAYTRAPMETLRPFQGAYQSGRLTQHHVRVNNYRVSIVPNTLINLYTRAQGTSHAHVEFHLSIDHFLVNFLHVFCHGVSLWAFPLWCGERKALPQRLWLVTRPNCPCMNPVVELPVILPNVELPDITLHEACRLGDEAVNEIAREVTEFSPEQFYVTDDDPGSLTLEEAQIALAQAHCNAVINCRLVIKALYTAHAASSAGYKALERYGRLNPNAETEALDLRYVPPDILLSDVAVIIYGEILTRYKFENVLHLGVALGLTPARELSWTPLLQDLDFAGVWYSIQQELHRRLPTFYELIHDNPVSAAGSFGAACYELCKNTLSDMKLVYLSYNPSPVIEKDVHRRLHAIRLDVIRNTYIPLLNSVLDRTVSEERTDEIYASLAAGLMSNEQFVFPFEQGAQQTRVRYNLFDMPEDFDEAMNVGMAIDEETKDWVWTPPALVTSACRLLKIEPTLIKTHVERLSLYGIDDSSWNKFMETVGITHVEIYRTSRVTCINRAKAEKLPLYHFTGTAQCVVSQGLADIVRPKMPCMSVRPFLGHQASQYQPVGFSWGIIPDAEFKGTMYNKRWHLRPIGAGNISMSKALNLIAQLGILPLPDKVTCACLGDGFGGYCTVLSHLASEGWLLYNTRPNRQGAEQLPIYAMQVGELRSNTISYSENVLGHYDLVETTTYMRFEQLIQMVDIVTLDAEMKPIVQVDRVRMLHYVASFFCRKGRRGSILLMKVMTEEAPQWLGVLGWLAPRCSKCLIVKVASTPLDGELMIVAQLMAPDEERAYVVTELWPPSDIISLVHNFSYRKYNRWIETDEGGLSELGLRPAYDEYWISAAKTLPLYGWSKLHEICRLGVSEKCKFRRDRPELDWLRDIQEYLRKGLLQCRTELKEKSADKHMQDYNTVKHETYVMSKMASIAGFSHVVQVRLEGHDVLTTKHCIDGYTHFARSYPGEIDLSTDIDLQRAGAVMKRGYSVHPFRHWKIGMRWAVSALCISRLL
uniref:RNA-directed RNA polymerase n=1 Tax=Nanning Chuvi tick virus 2 TaxID=2972095 RepID=A0A9E8A9J5_9VIRU|nr:MAG: polymerase [Nanning Chuvi tick virus 2]